MSKKLSLLTHQQIQKHPNNNSPAKASFRFSKSKRFKESNPECPTAFYTFTTQLSRKKPSIGSGKKYDFTKDLRGIPSCSTYDPNTYHQFMKMKGKSFGESRQKSQDRSYLIPQIHGHPGVGLYEIQKKKNNNSSYSIRSKTIDTSFHYLTYKTAPGPGQYEATNLDPSKLNVLVSKFKKPTLGVGFTSPRFKDIKNGPAPNSYQELDSLSPDSRYVNSRHLGQGNRPFSQQKRFIHDYWKSTANPGPGQYQKPSDFGVYSTRTNKGLFMRIQ